LFTILFSHLLFLTSVHRHLGTEENSYFFSKIFFSLLVDLGIQQITRSGPHWSHSFCLIMFSCSVHQSVSLPALISNIILLDYPSPAFYYSPQYKCFPILHVLQQFFVIPTGMCLPVISPGFLVSLACSIPSPTALYLLRIDSLVDLCMSVSCEFLCCVNAQ